VVKRSSNFNFKFYSTVSFDFRWNFGKPLRFFTCYLMSMLLRYRDCEESLTGVESTPQMHAFFR
jgi:hypothetical protein